MHKRIVLCGVEGKLQSGGLVDERLQRHQAVRALFGKRCYGIACCLFVTFVVGYHPLAIVYAEGEVSVVVLHQLAGGT